MLTLDKDKEIINQSKEQNSMTVECSLIDSTTMGSMFELKSQTHQNVVDATFP